ncbi:MAG: hypothetical protein HYT08_00330 [Candidatus Levybacteria bacterium]|nr:hypothetical protein [Candidatus Levybacteria bacterium]
MKIGKIIAIVIILLIVILGGVFLTQSKTKDTTRSITATQDNSGEIAPHYLKYSEENLAAGKTNGRPVLYFWASWCPTCKVLDEELKERSGELPDDVTILQVNYDTEKELKQKYNIVQQHTLVQVDSEGNEVHNWIGGGIETIKQQLI